MHGMQCNANKPAEVPSVKPSEKHLVVLPSYLQMIEDGCPKCRSIMTEEITVSIDDRDNVQVASCQNCLYVEEKYATIGGKE